VLSLGFALGPWIFSQIGSAGVLPFAVAWEELARARMPPQRQRAELLVSLAIAAKRAGQREHRRGAHGQLQGLGVHWEMWTFVQGGMTPLEALRAGTLNGAAYLGMERDLGSLEPGKLADLAVIDGNPLADIRDSEHVRYVMVNGRLYDASTMNELWPRQRERRRLWWE
jgi:hypothetical protein